MAYPEGVTEARNVHYVAYNGRHLAGLIIGVSDDPGHVTGECDLVVFTNMKNVNGVKNFGMQFHQDIAFDGTAKPTPGTWHYPERV
jgi:hypothetical protein